MKDWEREQKFWVLLTVFIAGVSILNVLSTKLAQFHLFGITVAFSSGIVAYALTFPITDAVAEVFGKARATTVVWLGFFANALVVFMTFVVVQLPIADVVDPAYNDSFNAVLGAVPRILLASMVAYLTAQFHDLWAFHFWRNITGEKMFWLRNNLSTMGSQLIDTTVFTVIAFGGIIPWAQIPGVVFGYWLLKVAVAIVDTPFVYLLVYWLKQEPAKAEDQSS